MPIPIEMFPYRNLPVCPHIYCLHGLIQKEMLFLTNTFSIKKWIEETQVSKRTH